MQQHLALSSKDDDINHLDKLSDKILLLIMDDLSCDDALDLIKLGCTCRRLRRLSQLPTLWIRINLLHGFDSWQQVAQLLSFRMHVGTYSLDLGRKRQRCCDCIAKKGMGK